MQIFLGGVSFSFRLTPQFLVSTLEGISGEPEPGGWLVGAWAGRGALPRTAHLCSSPQDWGFHPRCWGDGYRETLPGQNSAWGQAMNTLSRGSEKQSHRLQPFVDLGPGATRLQGHWIFSLHRPILTHRSYWMNAVRRNVCRLPLQKLFASFAFLREGK